MASLVTHMVKNLPAMQETQVQSLGQEDALEKKMATYSSILSWRIPWTGEPHGGTVHGISELCITEQLSLRFTSDLCIKGSVQFSSVAQSCLIPCNPMNRSTPGLPVHHQLPEFTQTHAHRVTDAIQPSPPLSSPSPPALKPSQHQGLF